MNSPLKSTARYFLFLFVIFFSFSAKLYSEVVVQPSENTDQEVYHLEPFTIQPHYRTDKKGKKQIEKLELSVYKMPKSFIFENVKELHSKNNPELIIYEANNASFENIHIEKLHVEVLNSEIQKLSAKKIFIHHPKNKKESLTILDPQLEFIASNHMLPEKFLIALKGINFNGAVEKFKSGEMQFGLTTESASDLIFKTFLKSGDIQFDEGRDFVVNFGALDIYSEGKAQAVSKEKYNLFKEKFVQVLRPIFEGHAKSSESLADSFQSLIGLVDDYTDLIIQMSPGDSHLTLNWDGLKIQGETDMQTLEVGPLTAETSEKILAKRVTNSMTASLPKISFHKKGSSFSLEALQLTGQSTYEVSATEYIQGMMSYLKSSIMGPYMKMRVFSSELSDGTPEFDPIKYVINYLTIYPDTAEYQLKIGKLSYETRESKGDYQEMNLGFQIKEGQVAYLGNGKFDIDYAEIKEKPKKKKKSEDKLEIPEEYLRKPKKDIVGGSFDFVWALNFPWQKIIAEARKMQKAPEQYYNVSELFLNENIGSELRLKLDYGEGSFSGSLDAKVDVPFGDALKKKPYPKAKLLKLSSKGEQDLYFKQLKKYKIWAEDFFMTIAERFLFNGQHHFSLKIDRLKSFEEYLTTADRGFSRSFNGLIGSPFAKIDEAQDTLSMLIEYHNGKVLVNGQENKIAQDKADELKGSLQKERKRSQKRRSR